MCVSVCVCVCVDTMNYHNSAKLEISLSKSILTHVLDLTIDPSITIQIPNMYNVKAVVQYYLLGS